MLSVQVAVAVAPYRYRWLVWDDPVIYFPTGIVRRLPRVRFGRGRVFEIPTLETIDISCLPSKLSTIFEIPSLAAHFYLRAINESDPISRFFDAFRGLEVLCKTLKGDLDSKAATHVERIRSLSPVIQTFQRKQDSLRRNFARMVLALSPIEEADADFAAFGKLYEWRNDLVHGRRMLKKDEAPDEESFELLHKYMRKLS